MNKYYKIPLNSFNTKIANIKLDDFLKEKYPSSYNAINDLKIYNDLDDDEEIDFGEKKYLEYFMNETLDNFNLPYFILAKSNGSEIIEIQTKTSLKIDGISEDTFQCSKEKFIELYSQEYVEKITNLFTSSEELLNQINLK